MTKYYIFLFLVFGMFSSCKETSNKSLKKTTYYLIRHAEKQYADEKDYNPELTKQGEDRASNWAKYFQNIKLDEVYATSAKRTQQTATPTARAKNLKVQIHNPDTIDIDNFIKHTFGKTILIVGHSDTTPMLVNNLFGGFNFVDIEDDNFSNLYVVTFDDLTKNVNLTQVPMSF